MTKLEIALTLDLLMMVAISIVRIRSTRKLHKGLLKAVKEAS